MADLWLRETDSGASDLWLGESGPDTAVATDGQVFPARGVIRAPRRVIRGKGGVSIPPARISVIASAVTESTEESTGSVTPPVVGQTPVPVSPMNQPTVSVALPTDDTILGGPTSVMRPVLPGPLPIAPVLPVLPVSPDGPIAPEAEQAIAELLESLESLESTAVPPSSPMVGDGGVGVVALALSGTGFMAERAATIAPSKQAIGEIHVALAAQDDDAELYALAYQMLRGR